MLFRSVPGTRHGPNSLSCRPQQPANEDGEPTEDPEFNDWVDQVYRFMHLLNPLKPKVPCLGACPTYISDTIADKLPLTYDLFPRSDRSRHADDHLQCVRKWFKTTECPLGLTNNAYAAFLRYTEYFFQVNGRLWRRDPQGRHKVVIDCDKRPAILADRKSTRLNSSHLARSRMPSSA